MKTAMSNKSYPSITKQNPRRPRLLRNINERVTQNARDPRESVAHETKKY